MSLEPLAALLALLARPATVLSGSAHQWPNAIPSLLAPLLVLCGMQLVISTRQPSAWILGGLFIAGAGAWADRPLSLVHWPWPSMDWALALFYALALVVVRAEWRHRPRWCAALVFAISWPWLDWIVGEPAILVIGITGTAALVVVALESTFYRYTETT